MAGTRDEESDENGCRTGQVAREVERARGERRTRIASRSTHGDEGSARVDCDHDSDHSKREGGDVDVGVALHEPDDRARRDPE